MLLAILIVGLVAAGIGASIVAVTRLHKNIIMQLTQSKVAQVQLQGILEWAFLLIASSPYKGDQNLRLLESDPTIDGSPGPKPLCRIGDAVVMVNRLSKNLFQLCASYPGASPVIVRVSPVSFPARFCLVTPASVNIGHSNYYGAVLCGCTRFVLDKPLLFSYPLISLNPPKFSSKEALASTFLSGFLSETQLSLRILDIVTPLAERFRRGAAVEQREGILVVRQDCTVLFKRNIVYVATDKGVSKSVELNAPLTVLVLGDCRVSGRLDGRVSLLVKGRVWICGDLVYLVEDVGVEFEGGKVVERGVASLVIVATGDIIYAPQKEDMIVCAALTSVYGSIHPVINRHLGKLLVFGTRICKKRPWRRKKDAGFRTALYIADPGILASPPPVLPSVTVPHFFGYQFAVGGQRR